MGLGFGELSIFLLSISIAKLFPHYLASCPSRQYTCHLQHHNALWNCFHIILSEEDMALVHKEIRCVISFCIGNKLQASRRDALEGRTDLNDVSEWRCDTGFPKRYFSNRESFVRNPIGNRRYDIGRRVSKNRRPFLKNKNFPDNLSQNNKVKYEKFDF